uniref:Uncharacterized protein n=1 Tax=uncultured marine virus TaxID=186617 RepID=A0A0F7L9X8_9VIRU|nr:hypothetical protein [uncultured marine virus]
MTEQAADEERTPNNVLTAAEMFRLTSEIQQRVADGVEAAVNWRAAEGVFSARLGRPVTRPNILTALSALDDVTQSQIIKPRGAEKHAGGDLDSKIESLDERLGRIAIGLVARDRVIDKRLDDIATRCGGISGNVVAVENNARARIDAVIECGDAADERLDAVDEVLAREGERLDGILVRLESLDERREAAREVLGRAGNHIAELKGELTRLEQRVGAFEKPFAFNSGGEFHDGLPAGGSSVNVGETASE